MKKMYSLRLFAYMLVVLIALGSCGDDNEEKPLVNGFYYDGANFLTQSGFVVYLGENPDEGTHDYKLYLHSSALSWSDDEWEVQGTGHAIVMDLHTESSTGLPNGTYTYSADAAQGRFTECKVGVDADFISESGTFLEINSGTITINSTGSNYNITYSLRASSGKELTGNFNGSLGQYDISDGYFDFNGFTYNGEKYQTPNAMLEYYGESGSNYNTDLTVYSDGLTYDYELSWLTGTGDGIYFEMFSPSDYLDEGDYIYSNTWNDFTYDESFIFISFNMDDEIGDLYEIVDGEVSISYVGEYTLIVDYDLELANGKNVIGHWDGIPNEEYYDDTKRYSLKKFFK